MFRTLVSSSLVAAFIGCATVSFHPAVAQTAQDRTWCLSVETNADQTIRGCTSMILSRKFQGDDLAKFHSNRAWAYGAQNDLDRALADYNDAIRIAPTAARLTDRARMYQRRKEYDRALADLDEALRLDPNFALAYYHRGSVWDDKGDINQALADIASAVRLNAKMPAAFHLRALIWKKRNNHERALADYDEAVRLAPNNNFYISARNTYVHSAHMDQHWERYLREIQDEQDYANWPGPPLDVHRGNAAR